VLDVHLQLVLRGEDSGVLADIPAGGGDHGHDLVAALLSGALGCLTGRHVPQEAGVFRCQGEYWEIAHGGRSLLLKDMKGLRHLARLLAHPDREIHALDLVRLEEGCGGLPQHGGDPQGSVPGFGDAGELLDDQAKRAYRRRLVALRDELDAADDPELRARLSEEMDMLAGQLAGAIGLGGQDVKAASAAERARLAVTNRIKAAIGKITVHDPALGRHFDVAVRTGVFCSYRPDPTARIAWTV
jgi:hypothetical protein